MQKHNCTNCGNLLTGNYCNNCGQPAETHRISAAYFLHDIPHSILHVDKGLFYTFWQLIKNPGVVLKDYLEGKRAKHFKPIAYVLMLSAISVLLAHWNVKLIQYLQHQRTGSSIYVTEHFFTKYQSAFILIMIPIVSIITWLVFKKNKYNFWEHMLVNTYMAAQLNVLVILLHIFILSRYLLTGSLQNPSIFYTTIFMTGFMTYYALTFSTLMNGGQPAWKLGLKLGIMCFLLASIYATGMAVSGISFPQFH